MLHPMYVQYTSMFYCFMYLAKTEMLPDGITARPHSAQQPAVNDSGHVVTSPRSCDNEVDGDVQDMTVADLLIMHSTFDCKYFTWNILDSSPTKQMQSKFTITLSRTLLATKQLQTELSVDLPRISYHTFLLLL